MAERTPSITISVNGRRVPFSRGLLAQSFMATGLQPSLAFAISQAVQDELLGKEEDVVTIARIRGVAKNLLQTLAGPQYARRYVRLRDLSHLSRPLIVLIGGTTGVGKSTIATEVAHRLGITRISSTDSIREVMRGIFTADLMPAIHESAFSAWRGLRVPVPEGANPVIVGFREQTAVVSTGIKALIDRAVLEGNSMVIEGIHLVPGYIDLSQMHNARVVELIVAVEDEQAHLSHFYIREAQTEGSRPRERYISNFENIRLLGGYIERMAHKHHTPIIFSHQLDRTIEDVLEHVIAAAIDSDEALVGTDTDDVSRRDAQIDPQDAEPADGEQRDNGTHEAAYETTRRRSEET